MSALNSDTEEPFEDRAPFFVAPARAERDEGALAEHQELVLRRADALAAQNRLKEALDVASVALRCGSAARGRLGALVDCLLRNLRESRGEAERERSSRRACCCSAVTAADPFSCPGCRGFLGAPVTAPCGHSYCRRCLERERLSRCRLCGDALPAELRTAVLLGGLLRKWFPEEAERARRVAELEQVCARRDFEQALRLAHELVQSDPGDALARVCRAEVYAGLKQYSSALADLDGLCPKSTGWPEVCFRKAKVLQEMGQVDESLQVFLRCLALDDDFAPAKKEVEKILCDLLSPASDSVKVGLREAALGTSPHLRGKTQLAAAPKRPEQLKDEQDGGRSESLERSRLSRTQSLRSGGPGTEEGLKRVCSAPQLGGQDKGTLLKRKLSASEVGPSLVHSGGNKHKKQGEAVACRTVPADLVEATDFECSLCMRLFFEPVTTPCGHTFCRSCLERCLDHTPQCPLCKKSLKQYLASRRYKVTQVLDEVIKRYLPTEHLERESAHVEETKELSDLTRNVPIFVCTMAYPTVPCPLHVFEPRYRLMIRRCMETGTRQFGMCISDSQKGFVDYGCMLQIRSVHFLPDGRSVVDTVGGQRFRVLSRGMRDGYCIADIEYLEDVKVRDSRELARLQELHDQVYDQARTWFQNLKSRFCGQILQHFGPMPEREADIQATPNGPACCWWLLAVLPVDPRYQLSVLSLLSLRERLLKIQHILTYLQSVPND
ncbi:LON peptidase N-terminal domain and RING finger protein 1 [Scleropages formosus]|uniref:LON peptidase N-terminal domain and ring finger 1 n=1 Tax=Scleropages formosus TaxID=113540 RepID=A0A8C9WA64_SCLFO|nr:LON peptidase N-terminal domain and RING finger protein 1 [Scleropages formosus]